MSLQPVPDLLGCAASDDREEPEGAELGEGPLDGRDAASHLGRDVLATRIDAACVAGAALGGAPLEQVVVNEARHFGEHPHGLFLGDRGQLALVDLGRRLNRGLGERSEGLSLSDDREERGGEIDNSGAVV